MFWNWLKGDEMGDRFYEAQKKGSPTKPKRKLIVIISTILGFILSLFIVFILNIKQKYKEEYNNT